MPALQLTADDHLSRRIDAALRDALERLTDVHRQILFLVGVEELTYQETGAVMGVPIGTVRSRVSRARALLRNVLEEKPRRTHNIG
jgi:RNA polymerase sigma-70 factor, ECF subfamily